MTQMATPLAAAVTGDWRGETAAPLACLLAGTWNGWAIPLFDRETVDQVIAEQEAMGEDDLRIGWSDGQVVVETRDPVTGECAYVHPEYIDGEMYWNLSLGWCWTTVEGGEIIAPSIEQRQRFAQMKQTLAMGSHSRVVEEDGAHVFLITAHLGEYTGDDVPCHEVIGKVRVTKDGVVTVLNVE